MFKRIALALGKGNQAFTLIELLVTITIIAVLAVLALGSYKKIIEKTQRIKCAGNLRQIGIAALQYAQDHNSNLPLTYDLRLGVWGQPNPGLIDLLGTYVESDYRVFYCTDAIHCVPPPSLAWSMTYNFQNAQPGVNHFLYTGYWWLISKSPSWDVTIFGNPPPKTIGSSMRVMATCPHFGGSTVHNRLYNVLFADGRIEACKADASGELISHISQSTLLFDPSYPR